MLLRRKVFPAIVVSIAPFTRVTTLPMGSFQALPMTCARTWEKKFSFL